MPKTHFPPPPPPPGYPLIRPLSLLASLLLLMIRGFFPWILIVTSDPGKNGANNALVCNIRFWRIRHRFWLSILMAYVCWYLHHILFLYTDGGRILGRNWVTTTNGFYYLSPNLSKSGLKLVCNVTLYMETSSLRTLKIMPRNLNEILRSWIQLQYIIEENCCKW